MKELTIEQKAKAYDEAIRKAKEWSETKNGYYTPKELCEEIFSELKESEDEMIRKWLICYFKEVCDNVSEKEKKGVIAWLEKQGEQKPIDKIEPKFHKGDFITDGERIFQIEETVWERNNRNDGSTYCESLIVNLRDGVTYSNKTDLKEYHLWTIQDAKDGDVLISNNASYIVLFKEFAYSEGDIGRFKSYCHCREGVFSSIEDTGWWCISFHPATKEQRDILMKAMTDAGYTFDFERKELNKIVDEEQIKKNLQDNSFRRMFEQKQVIDYPDNLPKDNWELIHEFVEKFGRIPKDEDELNVLVEYVLKRCKPAEWSEEDEELWLDAIKYLELFDAQGIHGNKAVPCINWLKSLRPQNMWKPSDKQMAALNDINLVGNISYAGQGQELINLYNDLKKLREE